MRTKTNKFFLALTSCDYDIIIISESWLKPGILNSELSSNYAIYRCDRNDQTSEHERGGGVLIAVKNELNSALVVLDGCSQLEQVTVQIKLCDKNLFVCGVYLRPNTDPNLYALHSSSVHQIITRLADSDSILVVGDYNLPYLQWSFDDDMNGYLPVNASTEQELVLTETLIASGLTQVCFVPNINDRILDLGFVNNPHLFECIESPSAILRVDAHHKPFILRFETSSEYNNEFDTTTDEHDLDFNRCDYEAVIRELNRLNWNELFAEFDVNAAVSLLYEKVFDVLRQYTPKKKKNRNQSPKQPWWNSDLCHQRNVLRKTRNRYFRSKTPDNKLHLQQLEADYIAHRDARYREYISNVQNNLKSNPSSFWNYVKERKRSNAIPSNVFFNGATSKNREESANLFADFFKTVYNSRPLNVSTGYIESLPSYAINLPLLTFEHSDVLDALTSIDPTKGPGPDQLPPSFIKRCAECLASPVCLIFNRSLTSGVFPDAWKNAALTPIHKSGNSHSVENYRPISILCCLSKVFESMLHAKIYNAAQPILSEFQHGFIKKRSTISNLMSFVSTLNTNLEKRQQVDAVYFDFSKAFDTVPHELAIRKFDRLGFPHWITKWLLSYLTGRHAYTRIGHARSDSFRIPSGVPQGSILGPLIFVIFVNDLCCRITSGKLMYADDLKIFRAIKSAIDSVVLQQDIDAILDWCSLNGMTVNASKCKVISFSKSRSPIIVDYRFHSRIVERVSSIKDLGLIIDSKLVFSEHISAITAKAFSVLGFLRRNTSDFDDIYALKTLYCSLVRSIIEYAVQIWAPYHEVQCVRIERVQKSFLRYALRLLPWRDPSRLPPYSERCQLIKLESLESRRRYLQRLFVFDVIANHIDCPSLLQNVLFYVPPRSLRNQPMLRIPRHRTVHGQNHPLDRCCRLFNEISDRFDFTVTKATFKLILRSQF